MVYSVKREELHAYRCKKYPRTCLNIGTKSNEFFFFYCCISSTFCFLFFSSFSSFFLHVIYYGFTPFPPSTCWSGIGSPFFLFPLPLLEPFIFSCKAACSLFRHHLHINAARELVGQHLMRGQQYFHIFVFSHSYPLSDIFSCHLLQGLSEMLL